MIASDGQRHRYLTSGTINLAGEVADKLAVIYRELVGVITEYRVQEAAVEQVFMHTNANSALKLGQARGAALVAAAQQGLAIAEYSARSVKQAVVGYGAADKTQVQHMVKLLLNLAQTPANDAADALAVAICHAHCRKLKALTELI